jgi:hypothetical protein
LKKNSECVKLGRLCFRGGVHGPSIVARWLAVVSA